MTPTGRNLESEYAQPVVEIVLPDRGVPVRGPTLEAFSAPDVVDQHGDAAVLVTNALSQARDLVGVEMIDLPRDPGAAEPLHTQRLGRFGVVA